MEIARRPVVFHAMGYNGLEPLSRFVFRETPYAVFQHVGPVDCEFHSCLPPLERVDLSYGLDLLDQRKYFILHAPRQTGKTSLLLALQAYLNRGDRFRCLYVNQVATARVPTRPTWSLLPTEELIRRCATHRDQLRHLRPSSRHSLGGENLLPSGNLSPPSHHRVGHGM